jgi:hypothetical protein
VTDSHERLALARRLASFSWDEHRGGATHVAAANDDENLRDLTLQTFTGSALFERTFDEGMSLVEETARYLDGRGRRNRAICRARKPCSMPAKACASRRG